MNRLLLILLLCGAAASASAAEVNLYDFEDKAIGETFTMKQINGDEPNASATVADDHTNPGNHVLCVKSKSWETLVAIPLPAGLDGQNFCDIYQTLTFDLLRLESSNDDYMQWVIMLGDDELYRDDSYPHQGDEGKWQARSYKLKSVKNNATTLYIGFNNDKADYYLDNISLSGTASQSTGTVIWTGGVSDVWDMDRTANFSDGTSPVTFSDGNSAIFNDSPGRDMTVTVDGTISAYDVTFNNNIHKCTLLPGEQGGKLTGRGSLTITQGADVVSGVANELEGGTNLVNGSLHLASLSSTTALGKAVNVTEGAIDFCLNNSSNDYAIIETPLIMNGKTLDVYTSRYTYWTSPVKGTGNINIYCGGERSYMGHQKNKVQPDWSGFNGTVTLYPYKEVFSGAGFYGVIFEGNKAFNPEDYETHRTNHVFENCKVIATDGTALASENNDRGVRIGELQLHKGATLFGYYKASDKSRSYFLLGNTGTDATLDGRMCPPEKNGEVVAGQTLGIIKEGKGTYTITGNNNRLTGGIRVLDGRILINNDTEEARSGKLSGATGAMHSADMTQIFVLSDGVLGGTGSIAGNVDIYGTLQPGSNSTGTLTLGDFAHDTPVALIVRPSSVIEIEIGAEGHDMVDVSGTVRYYNLTEDFEESTEMPVIHVSVAKDADITEGDEFTVITASGKEALDDMTWTWALDAPEGWKIEERVADGIYSVVLVAAGSASLDNVASSGRGPRVESGILHFYASDGQPVEIYNPDGRLLKSVSAKAGANAIPVDDINGVFIFSNGTESVKLTSK